MRSKRDTSRGPSKASNGLVLKGARAVKERAASAVADVTRKLRDEGGHLVSEQKQRAARGLEDVGTSIREAAGRFQDGPLAEVGSYMGAAAERVSRASEYLGARGVPDLLRDAERAVLRQPKLFLGGMFIVGLALARFLKATETGPDSKLGARSAETGVRLRRPPSKQRRRQRQPAG